MCFSFNKKQFQIHFSLLKKSWDWSFLTPLICGILSALILFIIFAGEWIEQNSLIFYSFISGLVLAGLIPPFQQMEKSMRTLLFFLTSFVVNFALFTYGKTAFIISNEIPSFFFAPIGFLASMALIVPGVSGSYLLLILGLYEKTLFALKQLNLFIISFFMLGVILGFILTAKWIQKMLENYWNQSLAVILGLMLGSLYSLYPLKESPLSWNQDQKLFITCAGLGFFLFLFFHFYLGKGNSIDKLKKETS